LRIAGEILQDVQIPAHRVERDPVRLGKSAEELDWNGPAGPSWRLEAVPGASGAEDMAVRVVELRKIAIACGLA
jgi:hypothetical protein